MPPSLNENSSKVVRKNFLLYSIEDNINISVLINLLFYTKLKAEDYFLYMFIIKNHFFWEKNKNSIL